MPSYKRTLEESAYGLYSPYDNLIATVRAKSILKAKQKFAEDSFIKYYKDKGYIIRRV